MHSPKFCWTGYLITCVLFAMTISLKAAGASLQTGMTNSVSSSITWNCIPFEYDPLVHPLITVQVRVNGSPPLPFIVDTGMNVPVLIDAKIAKKFKLVILQGKIQVATDNVKLQAASLGKLSLCGVSKQDDVTIQLPTAYLDDLDRFSQGHYAGILGMPLFSQTRIQFDFDTKKMWLQLKAANWVAPTGSSSCTLIEEDGLYSVPLLSEDNELNLYLLDTGSMITTTSAFHAWSTPVPANKPTVFGSVGGIHITNARLQNLRIGSYVEPNVSVCLANISKLGLDVLSRFRVTLDFRKRVFTLERTPNYSSHLHVEGWTGITLIRRKDQFFVASIETGNDAEGAGVRLSDQVLTVDKMALQPLSLTTAQSLLDGYAEQPAALEVQHSNGTRQTILVHRQSAFAMSTGETTGMIADRMKDELLTISKIVAGSSAQSKGLEIGDVISAIDGLPTSKMAATDIAAHFKKSEITFSIIGKIPANQKDIHFVLRKRNIK